MYEIFIHNETHTKKVYLKSNKSARAVDFEVHFQHFGECVHVPAIFTSHANSFLTFEGGQCVRLFNGITSEGSVKANRHTIKGQYQISW